MEQDLGKEHGTRASGIWMEQAGAEHQQWELEVSAGMTHTRSKDVA